MTENLIKLAYFYARDNKEAIADKCKELFLSPFKQGDIVIADILMIEDGDFLYMGYNDEFDAPFVRQVFQAEIQGNKLKYNKSDRGAGADTYCGWRLNRIRFATPEEIDTPSLIRSR